MVFSSISFLFFFLPTLLIIYYLIPSQLREARNVVLLAFSLFFYGYGGLRFLLLMLISITVNYVCGLIAAPRSRPGLSRAGVVAALIIGLGMLGWYKYAAFFVENLNRLGTGLPVPQVTLPIGISFFTFQGLSYVIDVYRGETEKQKNPLAVALYVSLFPQLVAGPIVRYITVADELGNRVESLESFNNGVVRLLFGLGKKMLIANTMGMIADTTFGLGSDALSLPVAWIGIAAYTLQIYFDFSAYSDMAIGMGWMFGFHFLENFNYPYMADTIREFWRRWHISLSTWFRDYLYIPLGGSRCSALKHVRNMFVVWLLTGLWHGASWNFIVWGLWYFVLLMGESYLWGGLLEKLPAPLRHMYTLLLVMISWVFFRADNLTHAVMYLQTMFGMGSAVNTGQAIYLLREYWLELGFAVIAIFPLKVWLSDALTRSKSAISRTVIIWGPRLIALLLFVISYMSLVTGSFNPFIYFRF